MGGVWGLTGSKRHSSSLQVVLCDFWCATGVNEGSDKATGRRWAGIHCDRISENGEIKEIWPEPR